MEDIIDIIVTETTNLIEITSQPTDEIIDVNIIDNREDVTLNVTPTVVEININSLTGNFGILWGEIEGTLSNQTDLQNALNLKADLVDGKVPSSQLPSYVDDVVEVANYAALPVTGEVGKIYITLDTNYIYRWTGSTYVEIKDSSAVWGAITGTLSNQTDLQNALNDKLSTSTAASTYVPYTGATGNVNLGLDYSLTAALIIKSGGTSTQFLKADGSIDTNTYATTSQLHNPVTIGTANGLTLSTQVLSLGLASSSANGALSSTDWTTFNNKQNALTNPVTGTITNGQIAYGVSGTNQIAGNSDFTWNNTTKSLQLFGTALANTVGAVSNNSLFSLSDGGSTLGLKVLSRRFSATGDHTGTESLIGRFVDATDFAYIGFRSGNVITFNTSLSTERWRMTSSGNLLLNSTTDNGSKLQVTGTTTISDSLGIGTSSLTGYNLRVTKNITGATTSIGIHSDGTIQSDVTGAVYYISTNTATVAATFTLNALTHFRAAQATYGAGSTVTSQYGFSVDSSLIGATNNYGFFGNIPAATNRYNLYMAGTAGNYLGGSLGIGAFNITNTNLFISKTMTGSIDSYHVNVNGTVQSDVTNSATYFRSSASTAAATFALGSLYHYVANQSTIGAGSTVTNQFGFRVESTLTGATNNYGFYGNIASGTNRYNLYMNGTANNYLAGNLLIGSTTDNSFKLQVTGSASISAGLQVPTINQTYLGASKTSLYADASRYAMQTISGYAIAFEPGGTEKMRITDTGNVGIGTTSPSSILTVLKTVSTNYGAKGNATLSLGTAGSSGEANLINFGYDAESWQPAYLGYVCTSGAGSSNGALVFATRDSTSNVQATERMRITSAGSVLVGTTSSLGFAMEVNGSIWAQKLRINDTASGYVTLEMENSSRWRINYLGRFSGYGAGALTTDASGNITAASDRTLKDIIRPVENVLENIMDFEPVYFKWNDKTDLDKENVYMSTIAQSIQKHYPDAVGKMADGTLTVQDRAVTAILVQAIKELTEKVKTLENK